MQKTLALLLPRAYYVFGAELTPGGVGFFLFRGGSVPEGQQSVTLEPVSIHQALGISLGVIEGLAYAALTLMGEARGESIEGQIAVAWVIRNRTLAPGWWGRDLKSVVLAPRQFSCWNAGDPNLAFMRAVKGAPNEFLGALGIMAQVYAGQIKDPTGGATHYHAIGVAPDWSSDMLPTATIGNHRFFRERE
jgi:N-acetylmuramoyl-L-alanine amidase